jgi:hypothetical protein
MHFGDRRRTVGGTPPVRRLAPAALIALSAAAIASAQTATPRLDTTTFVVVGEGLAAGQSGPGLSEFYQKYSFPALVAARLPTAFPQPLMQGPGVHDVLGMQSVPQNPPLLSQGDTRIQIRLGHSDPLPQLFVLNISVPNSRLSDALGRRPSFPIVQELDRQQTIANLILGFPAMLLERDVPLWTQAEYAEAMNPTLALIELGYYEALEAAVYQEPNRVPEPAAFRDGYAAIVRRLRALQSQVIVTTIPDPIDTGYFVRPALAAQLAFTSTFVIQTGYGVGNNDFLTKEALLEIGNQFIRRKIEPLPRNSLLRQATADQIRARVRNLNTEIQNVARDTGAVVYDLAALFARIKSAGVTIGSRRLTGEYFGGFYSLDGFYPGPAGHALIANEVIALLNRTYGRSFPAVDLNPIAAVDPVLAFRPAGGGTVFRASDLGLPAGGGE